MKLFKSFLQPLNQDRRVEVLNELEQASSPGFDHFLLVVQHCYFWPADTFSGSHHLRHAGCPAEVAGIKVIAGIISW